MSLVAVHPPLLCHNLVVRYCWHFRTALDMNPSVMNPSAMSPSVVSPSTMSSGPNGWIDVSLPAVVAKGYYGGVGTLYPFIEQKEYIDRGSNIQNPGSFSYINIRYVFLPLSERNYDNRYNKPSTLI
jgi:hypothetical protein